MHIAAEDGEEILTFLPTKEYQSSVLSSPELENGVTYVVYTGAALAAPPLTVCARAEATALARRLSALRLQAR